VATPAPLAPYSRRATFAEGDFTTAATEWHRVQQAVPEFKAVYFDLADSFLRRQDAPHPLEVLRDAAHRWPTDLEVLNAIGVVNTALGAFGDALATYRKALSFSARDLTTTFNLARTSEISYVTSLRQGVEHDRDRKEAMTIYRAAARDTSSLGALARDGLDRLTAIEVPHLQCAAPVTVASLPRAAIPAPPSRLAWDPEGRQAYVGVAATRKSPAAHLLVSVADAQVTTVQAEPDWAVRYWSWKAAESAPWLPSRRMVAETRQTRAVQGVVTPMTGRDPTLDAVRSVSPLSTVLTLSGDAVTETSADHPFSGARYSWSPWALGALAFVSAKGRVVIVDVNGQKLEVQRTAGALLPAWAEDGQRIAYLQGQGGGYALKIIDVHW
jgi:hypothetical protein